jgi:hypothetical protein
MLESESTPEQLVLSEEATDAFEGESFAKQLVNPDISEISKSIDVSPRFFLTPQDLIKSNALDIDKTKLNALPVRQYLDHSVLPALIDGLQALTRERPANPTEFLALYLLRNNKN